MAVHIVWSGERKMSLACRAGNLSQSRHYPAELIELRLQQWGRCSIHNSTRTWWRWHRLHQLILLFAPEKNVTRRREKKKIIGARRGENRRETKLYSAPGRCFMYLCVYKLEVDLMGLPEIRRSSWGGAETKPLFSLFLPFIDSLAERRSLSSLWWICKVAHTPYRSVPTSNTQNNIRAPIDLRIHSLI